MGNKIKYTPGGYWFGTSLTADLVFARRLTGKLRGQYIKAVLRSWL